jgi:hypothetical protein
MDAVRGSTDGRSETAGFRVDHEASSFDLAPLIGATVAAPGPVPVNGSIDCTQDSAPRADRPPVVTASVAPAASYPSPAEALRFGHRHQDRCRVGRGRLPDRVLIALA